MNVNDYNDPIAEFLDDINQLREQLELKDQILKSVARQGIEQQRLITALCDALDAYTPDAEGGYRKAKELIHRAREATNEQS